LLSYHFHWLNYLVHLIFLLWFSLFFSSHLITLIIILLPQ
jgi:hypothetical protein